MASLTTKEAAADWHQANLRARREVALALRATDYLRDIPKALKKSAGHVRVLRHLLAPPISQDQFGLLCRSYSKGAENKGSPVKADSAVKIAATILAARDRKLTRWLDRDGPPRRREICNLLQVVPPLLSQQIIATVRRTRMSVQQEGAAIARLEQSGWTRRSSNLISKLSDVPARHFLHKTRFATKTQPQEVDIACGLGRDVVLAMECKVTNDATNSVKRINDILKKAKAWQDHWGSFVKTAALLQGVIGYKDVRRLLEADVHVFWSHKLDDFRDWIETQVKN